MKRTGMEPILREWELWERKLWYYQTTYEEWQDARQRQALIVESMDDIGRGIFFEIQQNGQDLGLRFSCKGEYLRIRVRNQKYMVKKLEELNIPSVILDGAITLLEQYKATRALWALFKTKFETK